MVKFNAVSKSFGDIVALNDLSFEIKSGEFVFVTGPSGCGKTTVIRLILRDLLPDSGEIFIDDVEVEKLARKDVPQLRRQIGTVFQDFKVLPERTVRENIEVALAVCEINKEKWNQMVEKALSEVGLEEKIDLFPAQLSGGELQRVSLARALVVDPKIILADEPTGNLDWDTSFEIMKILENINKKGKTVIVATHHMLIVDKMKKRVIDLKDNKSKSSQKKTEEKKTKGKEKKEKK